MENLDNVKLAIGLAAAAFLLALFTYALLKAATFKEPAMLTTALALLTLISIGGYALNSDHQELVTIAATGIGALAGSVTATFQASKKGRDQDGGSDDDSV